MRLGFFWNSRSGNIFRGYCKSGLEVKWPRQDRIEIYCHQFEKVDYRIERLESITVHYKGDGLIER